MASSASSANSVKELQDKIALLEERLDDAKKRLPAHSVKPTIMHQIFDAEDELEGLYRELKQRQEEGRDD